MKTRIPQLVRDKMVPRPGIAEANVTVSPALATALLVAKIHSETEEIARDVMNPEEYADVLECLMSLAQTNNVDWDQVEQILLEKRGRKGALATGNLWIPMEFLDDIRNETAA